MSSPRRVVVCGAGVMGASVAYFLAHRGVAVTVVERSGVACAASGKSGGFLALDWCDGTPLGPRARPTSPLPPERPPSLAAATATRPMAPPIRTATKRRRVRGQGLFVDYRTADGRALEPEIFPRPDGEVYVCGMADPAPLPDSPDAVEVSEASCATLARAAGRVSTALAAARIVRRQACYRPVTDDGLPLIGRVPGVRGAYVATGHGPWGILNAPATGLAMAELVADGAASLVDLRAFDPARLTLGARPL